MVETKETPKEEVEPKEPSEEPVPKKKRRPKKHKKLIRRKVSKKEKAANLPAMLRLVVESGEVEFGTHNTLKNTKLGTLKAVVLAGNAPPETQENIRRYCALSDIPIIKFPGSSLELGSVCGRPHPVAVLAVKKLGASNLLDFVAKKK